MSYCIERLRAALVVTVGLVFTTTAGAQTTQQLCQVWDVYSFPNNRLGFQSDALIICVAAGLIALVLGQGFHLWSVRKSADAFPIRPTWLDLWLPSLLTIAVVISLAAGLVFMILKKVSHLPECVVAIHASSIHLKLAGTFALVLFILLAIPFLSPNRRR